jgi:hypothetical protein
MGDSLFACASPLILVLGCVILFRWRVVTKFLEQVLLQIAPCYASFRRLNHGAALLWDRLVARVIEFLASSVPASRCRSMAEFPVP